LLTVNWLYVYYIEPVAYPYQNKEDLLLASSQAVKFVDAPINTKGTIQIRTLDAKDNLFNVKYNFEITLLGNVSVTMHMEQGFRVDQVTEIEAWFNSQPLNLSRAKSKYNKGEYILNILNASSWSLEFTESELTDMYFIPDMNLTGNGYVNKLQISVTLYRTLKSSGFANIPWLFSHEKYAVFIDIPTISAMIAQQGRSDLITFEARCNYPNKIIEKRTSGWMGTYTLTKFVENPYRSGLVFTAPVEQNTTSQDSIFYAEVFFSENNRVDRLIVTFIPDYTFLFILLFLYTPLVIPVLRKNWGFPRRVVATYGIILMTFFGLNVLTAGAVFLLLTQIAELTSIYFVGFALLFPIFYLSGKSFIPRINILAQIRPLWTLKKKFLRRGTIVFLVVVVALLVVWQRESLLSLLGMNCVAVREQVDVDVRPVKIEDSFFSENGRWYINTTIELSNYENFDVHLLWTWFGVRNITFVDGSTYPYAITANFTKPLIIGAHTRSMLPFMAGSEGLDKQPTSAEARCIICFAESQLKGQLDYIIPDY
jgi:hypothetical protein